MHTELRKILRNQLRVTSPVHSTSRTLFGCTGLCYLNISCLWGEARSAQGQQEVATAVHDGACATAFLGSW